MTCGSPLILTVYEAANVPAIGYTLYTPGSNSTWDNENWNIPHLCHINYASTVNKSDSANGGVFTLTSRADVVLPTTWVEGGSVVGPTPTSDANTTPTASAGRDEPSAMVISPDDGSSLPMGAIVGGVVGAVLLIAAVGGVIWVLTVRRRRARLQPLAEPESDLSDIKELDDDMIHEAPGVRWVKVQPSELEAHPGK